MPLLTQAKLLTKYIYMITVVLNQEATILLITLSFSEESVLVEVYDFVSFGKTLMM